VLGLLSEEGRSKGRLVDDEAARPQQAETDTENAPIELPPVRIAQPAPASVTSPTEAPQSPQQAVTNPAASREQPVSQTVRVSGAVAKTLRDAWLEERRQGDVLLSYTDFATRVVIAGLDVIGKEGRLRR
jgi:hypothetical protein